MAKQFKTLRALKPEGLPEEAPPMEGELPGRKLSRLTAERDKAVEELQTLKRNFAAENIKAQQCHQAIPTSQITFVERKRKELSDKILSLNLEIGATNRAVREHRAERQNGHRQAPAIEVNDRTAKKEGPLKKHPEWATYFLLAARDELAEGLFEQVERSAKLLLQHALETGIES